MKKLKSFKLMLLGLMALVSSNAFAQMAVGDEFMDESYIYKVTKVPAGATRGEVNITAVLQGANPVNAEGVLELPGQVTTTAYGTDYNFNVRSTNTNALQYFGTTNGTTTTFGAEFTGKTTAKSVVIPKEWSTIITGCFTGYTNIKEISFEANSVVSTIQSSAFATTQIKTFDFSNCIRLTSLNNGVFVEAGAAKNSYIETIKLPAKSTVLKDIASAFKNLVSLTKIENLENSAIQTVVEEAFLNDAKLTELTLPGTVQTIAKNAFKGSGIEKLTIDVTSITTIGDGTTNVYGTETADQQKLKTLILKGDLGGIVQTSAFAGCTNLATLNLSDLSFVSGGQFATNSFQGCTSIETVSIKAINDTPASGETIDDNAFQGCTKLASVSIGSINSAAAIGEAAFGNKLKTVTIGTVKAGAAAITTGAFVFDNVKVTALNLATGTDEYLSSDDAATAILAAGAFDFSAVNGASGWVVADYPSVNIGKIRSVGGVFAQGAIKGNDIYALNFKGEIAANGIDKCPISDETSATTVAALKLATLNFEGKIGTGGIATNAFANLPNVTTLNFKGELVEDAIATGAFEALKANSKINYTCATIADEYVNPFVQDAFQAGSTNATARDITIEVTNAVLKDNYLGNFDGSGIDIADGEFDIYRVKFYVAPVPEVHDNTFLVYQNANDKKTAWGRINFAQDKLSSTLGYGTTDGLKDLKIQRVQTIDGAKVKLTLYGTYTDEDDALNAATIYMVPLKVKNGYYHIAKSDNEVIIAKAEKVGADFTVTDVKVPVLVTGYSSADESLWAGLHNSSLQIAENIMTNQQLIDGNAKNGLTPVDITNKDVYIMTDPAKYKGFRIDKITVTKDNNAYINTGWYFMLLKHYNGAATAAPRVIWLDENADTDPNTTGIFEMKQSAKENAKSNTIYTLQGVRVSAPVKGQIYIMNGKKYIAK